MHTPEQTATIALMKQAGLEKRVDMEALFRFAELVAASERERCQAVIELWGNTNEPLVTVNAQNMARKLQRAIDNPGVRAAAIRNTGG